MNRAAWLLVSSALVAACSSSGASQPASRGPAPIVFDLAATVPVGQERYVCELVQMPSAGTFVSGGSYAVTQGTHHFLLFRTSLTSAPANLGQPVDCFEGEGVMKYERGFVTGGRLSHDEQHFPPGLALAFAPGEVLLLQAHLLDASDHDLAATVHVELDTLPAAEVTTRVGTFRFYDPYIVVPGRGASTARMRCHLHHDVTLLSAGPHMHKRGVGYRAFLDPAGAPRATTPFYTTTDWLHPPYWTGPLPAAAGSDIRFECDYQNPDAQDVVQGLSADADEMCMFSAFYAPETDRSDDDCTSMDEHGTGGRSCAQTTSCLALCAPSDAPRFETGDPTVGGCWQRCIVDSCPNATAALLPQLECTKEKCASACASFGAECSQCVAASCKTELDACQALACDP